MIPFQRAPLWYKDAVIYEVHVKCFRDAEGTGMGDFRGLVEKLDYIRELGVTAIWLLPFYPSPLRDDGYDIQDYVSVNPAYGTLEDFDRLLVEAHARGLYVITELVLNHTSDRHPWFQRARRAPKGSAERDFYVWSETKERYADARIIFSDSETSNWAWDPVAEEFYWHRFYSHQPDLNFENPAVHAALLEAVDFWLGRGVDGLRLDAVPYLYEREGTSCENLPETHAFLRKLSGHVRENFEHRMLLAEANQWPEDSMAYFGDGGACDMAFHFPLMPRMYMAVEMEDGFPLADILEQTPDIPDACQWALFLRNHDELTLEMVTDAERDYMYRVYAKDRRARLNLGIRRRLAPLLRNNRRKIELLNLLLLSLPGTPVLYYGDEIGMGDNLYLGDRDGVRTPMQWNPDRNAGFSAAPAHQLCLPLITDSQYHYETVNVESQERDPNSLLWWTRRMLRLRKGRPAFGRGTIRFLRHGNNHILAFLREWEGEVILVLANLSQHPQTGYLDLSEFAGAEPVELSSGNHFPVPRAEPYPVMLGGHDALWLLLRTSGQLATGETRPLFDLGHADTLTDFFEPARRAILERRVLVPHVLETAWFQADAWLLDSIHVKDVLPLGEGGEAAVLLVQAVFLGAEPKDYALIAGFIAESEAGSWPGIPLLAKAVVGGRAGWLCEAERLPAAQKALLDRAASPGTSRLSSGRVVVESRNAESPPRTDAMPVQLHDGGEEIHLGVPQGYFLRWFRALREDPGADLEVLEELSRQKDPPPVPRCISVMRYHPAGNPPVTLGYTQEWIAADRNLEGMAAENLRQFLEGVATSGLMERDPDPVASRVAYQDLPPELQDCIGGAWAEFTPLLGQRIAQLHGSLARCGNNPAFAPEPQSLMHQQAVFHGIRTPLRRHLAHLAARMPQLSGELGSLAREVVEREPDLIRRLKRLIESRTVFHRIRIHGDLSLRRILFTGKDFVFTGFDGEPWRPYNERRFKFCALRDVAALQQSFAAGADAVWGEYTGAHAGHAALQRWVHHWAGLSGGMVLDSYLEAAASEAFLPKSPGEVSVLMDAFRIERASFELNAFLGVDDVRVGSALRTLLAFP